MLTLAPFFAPDDVTRPRLQKLAVGVHHPPRPGQPRRRVHVLMADLPAAHDELFGAVARADQGTSARHAAAQNHRSALTGRLTDAVKLVAAHFLRDEARAAAYFRTHLLHP